MESCRMMKLSKTCDYNRHRFAYITKALLFLVLLSGTKWANAAPDDGLFVPDSGVLLTIGQDVDSVNDYVASVGVQPGGVANYVGIADLDGLLSSADAGAGRNNVAELAATYPNSALVVGVSMNNQLGDVVAGTYNQNIDTLLTTLASYDRPVFLRWAYEVDGVQWNVSHTPALIRQSFTYVRNRIDALGFTDTIALVWQVSSYCYNQYEDLNTWYPGNDVVDWIGLSYFSPQDCVNQSRVNQAGDFARANGKPLFINESTPQRFDIAELTYSSDGAGGSNRESLTAEQLWSQWFEGYFRFIRQDYADVVRAITYINADWDSPEQYRWGGYTNGVFTGYTEGYWGDSRVQANALIQQNWLTETNQDYYVKLTDDLFTRLGYGVPNNDQPGDGGNDNPVDGGNDNPVDGGNDTPVDQGRAVQGIEYLDDDSMIVYHQDQGWTADWHYLCADGGCYSGELVNGYYQRQFDNVVLGQAYSIQFKVQDAQLSQFISDAETFTFEQSASSGGDTPVGDTPVGDTPVDDTPVDDTPVDDTPVDDTPVSGGAPSGELGITYVSDTSFIVFHQDNGWTANWNYLCVNDGCYPGELVGGYYQRLFENVTLGQVYAIQFKVQDNQLSQYISDTIEVTFTQDSGSTGGDPGNGGSDPGNGGGDPGNGGSDPGNGGGDPGNGGSDSGNGGGDPGNGGSDPGNGGGDPGNGGSDPGNGGGDPIFPEGGGTRVENGVVISEIAERYRVRHELSGNDFNNFNVEYWVGRFGYIEMYDYTRAEAASQRQQACGTTEPCVVVYLNGAVPAAMSDSAGQEKSCNQQVPNWRYHKDYGSETNFLYGYVMQVQENGTWIDACSAQRQTRATTTQWRAVMRNWANIPRGFSHGDQIEFEVTINFARAQLTGDNVNYYGQTFRYILGEGFTVNNQDSAVGPVGVSDSFAKLGGDTTVPHLAETGGTQTRLSFLQHAYNLSPIHVEDWLVGRRLFHTNFENGNHIEELLPGPQAIGGNLPFPEMAGLATNPIQPACTSCHTNNGNGPLQSGQTTVPNKLIGMGLLGGIPDAQIEQWASENGGRVNYVNLEGEQRIGRYGWDAGTATVKHQIAEALFNDIGVGTGFAGFGQAQLSDQFLEQLVTYTKLIAVPTPQQNLTTMRGHQLFEDYGCASCHRMTATTDLDTEFPELSNQTIHPYTDLLLHDLGEGEFRTAPLWGLGLTGLVRQGNSNALNLMHDGASTSVDAAIQRHNGAAANAKAAYNAGERQALIDYLMSL